MRRIEKKAVYRLLLVLLAWLGSGVAADGAERVALVIGNSRYDHAPYLSNPQRDAEAIARMLSGMGFSVTGPLLNQSKAQMDAALKQFGRQARAATAAVVYFSGHGVEVGGQNYLIPKDAVLEREGDVSLEAVALNVVLDQISGANGYRLVILDACRDNPLANNMQRANGAKAAYRGLAPVEPSGQTYVAYAARAGQRSQDGAAGGNSPYATALLKYLPQPGLPLERLFGKVREEVKRETKSEQTPYLYGEFGVEPIYLAGPVTTAPVATAPVAVAPLPAVDHDLIAWQSAEKCGTAACIQAYLEDYPKGRYARMAKARLQAEAILPTPKIPFAPAATSITKPASKLLPGGPKTGAVIEFQVGDGLSGQSGAIIADLMMAAIADTGRFILEDRLPLSAAAKIAKTQELGSTGLLDPKIAAEVGRLYGLDAVVIGGIYKLDDLITVTARLIDTRNAAVLRSGQIQGKDVDTTEVKIKELATMITSGNKMDFTKQ